MAVDSVSATLELAIAASPGTPPSADVAVDPGPTPEITAEQAGGSWYSDARLDGRIEHYYGTLQLPVAKAGAPPAIVQTHAPYATRAVNWTVERVGARPAIPHIDSNNPAEVPLYRSISPTTPAMDVDGMRIYRTNGRYVWAYAITPGSQDRLPAGVAPFDAGPSSLNDIQPGDFDRRLLDSSSAVPVGNGQAPVTDIKSRLDYSI